MADYNCKDSKSYKSKLNTNPSLRRQRNVHTVTCLQSGVDYALDDQDQYDLLNSSSIQCPPLTGPHVEIVNETVENDDNSIDLAESQEDIAITIKNAVLSIVKTEPLSPISETSDSEFEPNLYGRRKRKYNSDEDEEKEIPEPGLITPKNQEEIIKAARSLFSKRTRTLYNWLSPGISKTKLKTSVSSAWDGLPNIEKDFYISQVLGRFGVPSVKVMVNPQILGFNGTVPPTSDTAGTEQNITEFVNNIGKKKRRSGRRSSLSNSSFSLNDDKPEGTDEDKVILTQIRDDSLHDFADDPELHNELEQFKWALHVTNAHD